MKEESTKIRLIHRAASLNGLINLVLQNNEARTKEELVSELQDIQRTQYKIIALLYDVLLLDERIEQELSPEEEQS